MVLWLHVLKKYCKSLVATNSINALFCWFAHTDFNCKSWFMFIEDLCIIANITETPQWKKVIAREGSVEHVHKLLCRTILPFYMYLYKYKPDTFLDLWISDMIAEEDKESFTKYLESISEENYL